MLKFKKIQDNNTEVRYQYFPEGHTESGIVAFNKETKDFSVISLPDTDNHKKYALKMISRIRKYIADGSLENEGAIAWY